MSQRDAKDSNVWLWRASRSVLLLNGCHAVSTPAERTVRQTIYLSRMCRPLMSPRALTFFVSLVFHPGGFTPHFLWKKRWNIWAVLTRPHKKINLGSRLKGPRINSNEVDVWPAECWKCSGATAVFPQGTELKECLFDFTRSKGILTNSPTAMIPQVSLEWVHSV